MKTTRSWLGGLILCLIAPSLSAQTALHPTGPAAVDVGVTSRGVAQDATNYYLVDDYSYLVFPKPLGNFSAAGNNASFNSITGAGSFDATFHLEVTATTVYLVNSGTGDATSVFSAPAAGFNGITSADFGGGTASVYLSNAAGSIFKLTFDPANLAPPTISQLQGVNIGPGTKLAESFYVAGADLPSFVGVSANTIYEFGYGGARLATYVASDGISFTDASLFSRYGLNGEQFLMTAYDYDSSANMTAFDNFAVTAIPESSTHTLLIGVASTLIAIIRRLRP